MEQNKDINQGQNNVPDNPYTQYYQDYIFKPVIDKKPIGPKQIISIILCGVSSAMMVFLVFIWTIIIISGNAGRTDDVKFTIIFLSITSLGPAIVAKVLNRKSIWALINIICLSILFVAVILMTLL